jgi:hypothetical protein
MRSEQPAGSPAPRQIADLLARKAILIGVPIQFTPLD